MVSTYLFLVDEYAVLFGRLRAGLVDDAMSGLGHCR